jgi:MFS family permease
MSKIIAITRTVWILSWVSLSNDMASEMLYPVMPLFLKSIGFSVLLIGMLEGLAEATAGLSKGYFGKLSDSRGQRLPFVRMGYALGAITKPMLAVFAFPLWIFIARTLDRLGKGIRTGARDAILSGEATPETKARVFGFHRAWDTVGAFLGPCLGLLFLYFYPGEYRILFLIAFVPGILAVILSFTLSESPTAKVSPVPISFFSFLGYWKESSPGYRKVVSGILLFTVINSSDVFLLLKAREAGLTDTAVIGVYIFYNLVYAIFAYPAGALADKLGLKKTFIFGLILFAFVYAGMGYAADLWEFGILFFVYGIYAACNESIAKAWITNLSDKKDVATAVGAFSAVQSVGMLVASSMAGMVWYYFGARSLFLGTAGMAILVSLYFVFMEAVKED